MTDNTGMRPRPDSRDVRIPISWDVKKQDKKNWGMTITLAVLILVILLISSIGVLFSSNGILAKIFIIVIPLTLYLYIYRFGVFREAWVRNQYELQKESDFSIDDSKWWKIYSIEPTFPFICHYNNGYKGVFLKLKKDVIQGKQPNVEYEHYQAIADVQNYIANQKLRFCYIDYMDNVGNDERLSTLMSNSKLGGNKALEDMLSAIYYNLEKRMQQEFSSFDVVLIYGKMQEGDLKNKISNIIEGYKQANYKAVNPARKEEIRILAKELFNLESFSIVNATQNVVSSTKVEIIRPIQIIYANGTVEKINSTFAEQKLEKEEKFKKRKEKKVQTPKTSTVKIDNRKGNFGKQENLLDIFSEDLNLDDDGYVQSPTGTTDLPSSTDSLRTSIIDFDSIEEGEYLTALNNRDTPLEESQAKQDKRGIVDTFDIFDNPVYPTLDVELPTIKPTSTSQTVNNTILKPTPHHEPITHGGTQKPVLDLDIFDKSSDTSPEENIDIF